MDTQKHKLWIKRYLKKTYGCDIVMENRIELDNRKVFVLESYDARTGMWEEQLPFLKDDRFYKTSEFGSDRDGHYFHYVMEFPFDIVEAELCKEKDAKGSQKTWKLTLEARYEKLRTALAIAVGRLDTAFPDTPEGRLCREVYDMLNEVLKETAL